MKSIFEDIFYIIGLDPSLACTGIAVFEVSPKSRTIKLIVSKIVITPPFDRVNRFDRYKFICDSIRDVVIENKVELACIEGYSFGSNGRAALDLPELGGVIRLSLLNLGIRFTEVSPTALKKTITGKGNNYDKSIMVKNINSMLGVDFKHDEKSHNAADAAGLGLCLADKLLKNDFNYDLVVKEASDDLDEKKEEGRLKRLRKKHGKKIPEKHLNPPKKKDSNPEEKCVVLDVEF